MVDTNIEDILTFSSHENISIKIYNPGVNLGENIFSKIKKFSSDFRSANQQMHNKTFIVNRQTVINGGRNIADEYFDYDHKYNFRDRDTLLIEAASKNVRKSFHQFWNNHLSKDVTTIISLGTKTTYQTNRFNKLDEYVCNPNNF